MKIEQRDAASLAKGYSGAIRRLEVASIGLLFALMAAAVVRLAEHIPANPWLMLLAVCSAYLGADLLSGVVHWMGDTWCSPATRVVGPTLIRPFREHHVDQKAITRHDFVETNGNNCLASMPGAVLALAMPLDRGWLGIFLSVFLVALVFWVLMTNQFHKWAHLDAPPPWIAWLQRWHLILPPAHHAVHHAAPFNRYYCITVGWLNRPLHAIRFFPALEWLISSITGALPRHDDIGPAAAMEIAEEPLAADRSAETVNQS
ncbi:MAG TPA: fatty acid desaturase family protein [Myxococcales bacterium]|jgi:ubiquitin-conjugating enzyme E2 variant|nr:fatty acid desaturase family protein [Myxococcales bacterium]